MNYSEIPEINIPRTENLTLNLNNEKLVDVFDYSCGEIICDMQYFRQGISGSVNRAFLRESAAKRLVKARSLLPNGYTFKIFDAWRPYEVQYKLYYDYFNSLAKKAENKNLSDEELHKKASAFVSFPDRSKKISFAHSSGGAVDLTIVDKKGKELDMGTCFDCFEENSYTAFYETHTCQNEIFAENRRLLYGVMTLCGFTNLPTEWWHYDFGDVFWSALTGKGILYDSVYEL